MAGKKLTVVISQSQSTNPQYRDLEESLAARLMMQGDVDVALVPHLYDLHADHTGMLFLKSIPGDVVVLAWLYPRPIRWILHRQGVRGQEGLTLLEQDVDDEDEDDQELSPDRGVGIGELPARKIYCIDLRVSSSVNDYFEEIQRICKEKSVQTVQLLDWIQGSPQPEQLARYLKTPDTAPQNGHQSTPATEAAEKDPVKRRWYPVIDYDRCTNCLECIDFCLFGVYGVTSNDLIVVETQDNCKKGCPACSRVCPENAILFPGHKTPAIAGAPGEVAGFKVDLSKLFGADTGIDIAVRERDRELVADGREAVGNAVGLRKRQSHKENQPKDELDELMDCLDDMPF
ncbi:MAG: ferredoxin family protein [Planctomycetaceae bacterium]|nr:ferredoxin family protein [Planctomycetaceae bacterium]